ncbi:haloacid dehalogenase type II [Arhodomonas sp. AD133]|uniref:haloacid dehalogenase type II n=1 Tax=Arhodomonas sp. AD133 TaxID=3415009 RepID=UPI003EB7766A
MTGPLVFDVNETLLDLRALDPVFERLFGDADARGDWFRQVLLSAMTVTLTGRYEDFSTVGAAALTMVAERRGVSLSSSDRQQVADGMRRLPPHPDVPAALARLHDEGCRLVALTNSPGGVMREQLTNAGIRRYFSDLLSVEDARALKPARVVYETAARRLDTAPGELTMIAAHGWDLAGAMTAGWRTAFIARPGQVLEPLFPRPEIVGADLTEVANALLA